MRVKYIGKGSLHSKGLRFEHGVEYDLPEDIANYLTQTFASFFKFVEVDEPEVRPKPARKSRVKKVVAPKE